MHCSCTCSLVYTATLFLPLTSMSTSYTILSSYLTWQWLIFRIRAGAELAVFCTVSLACFGVVLFWFFLPAILRLVYLIIHILFTLNTYIRGHSLFIKLLYSLWFDITFIIDLYSRTSIRTY